MAISDKTYYQFISEIYRASTQNVITFLLYISHFQFHVMSHNFNCVVQYKSICACVSVILSCNTMQWRISQN